MRRPNHILLLAFALLCAFPFCHGQSQAPDLAALQAAVEHARARTGPQDTAYANCLLRLADAQQARGDFRQAEKNLQGALLHARQVERRGAIRESEFLVALGKFYWAANRFETAVSYADTALLVIRLFKPDAQTQLIAPLLLKATVEYSKAEFDASEAHYREAGRYQEMAQGPQSAELAETLNNIGAVYVAQRKLERALLTYQHALNMQEAVLGKGHVASSTTLNNIATVYESLGDFKEAEAMLKQAYLVRRAGLPLDAALTAHAMDNLVLFYANLDRHVEARAFLAETFAFAEQQGGKSSLAVAGCHDRMAAYFLAIQQLRDSEQHLSQALAIRELQLPAGHPAIGNTLLNLGKLHNVDGQHGQAVIDLNRALEHFTQDIGLYEHALTETLGELFTAYFAQGQVEPAEDALNQLLDIKVALYGEKDSHVVEVLLMLQRFFRETNQSEPLQEVQEMLQDIGE